MSRRWSVGGLGLALLATGCHGAYGTAQGAVSHAAFASPVSLVPASLTALVTATTPHSKAAATELADAALDQVGFPAGSTRLATRPALGTADLHQEKDLDIVSRVGRVRWWSVPGTVADAAGCLAAHPPQGIGGSTQGALYVWSAATPLAFDMDAYLVQDGSA